MSELQELNSGISNSDGQAGGHKVTKGICSPSLAPFLSGDGCYYGINCTRPTASCILNSATVYSRNAFLSVYHERKGKNVSPIPKEYQAVPTLG